MKPPIVLIAAGSRNGRVIGTENKLPWPSIQGDLEHFKTVTLGPPETWKDPTIKGHPVIMGRKTWESFDRGSGSQPFKRRQNIVITRNPDLVVPSGVWVASSVEDALEKASLLNPERICIIGGEQIYRETIDIAQEIFYTEVYLDVVGDTHFPELPHDFNSMTEIKRVEQVEFDEGTRGVRFHIQHWTRERL